MHFSGSSPGGVYTSTPTQPSQDQAPPPPKEQTEPVDFSSSQTPNFATPRGFEPAVGFPRGPSPSGDSLARYRAANGRCYTWSSGAGRAVRSCRVILFPWFSTTRQDRGDKRLILFTNPHTNICHREASIPQRNFTYRVFFLSIQVSIYDILLYLEWSLLCSNHANFSIYLLKDL